jgi:hypothetical protein
MVLQMQWAKNYLDVSFGLKKCQWRATKDKLNIISVKEDVKIVKLEMYDLCLYCLILRFCSVESTFSFDFYVYDLIITILLKAL